MRDDGSEKKECQWCDHWNAIEEDGEVKRGQCRYLPPKIVLDPHQPATFHTLWPLTEPTAWCGAWDSDDE